MVAVRDQLKDEISEEYQAKLALEAAVAEATEQMTRAKNLYAEYTSRVEDMTARERVLMAGEADVQARQEQVGRREATLKTREEWISKREGQFRVQQRALDGVRLLGVRGFGGGGGVYRWQQCNAPHARVDAGGIATRVSRHEPQPPRHARDAAREGATLAI